VADFGKFVVFKPVSGGYVYRAPNAWLFGPRAHYLMNEVQKAEIVTVITSSSRTVLWIAGLSWISALLLLGAGSLLWVHRDQHPGLSGVLAVIIVAISTYIAMLVSRQLLLFRLRPILAALPPTNERITNLEERQAIATAVPAVTISPARRKVIRIASIVAVAGTLGLLISRTIDMYEVNHSVLLALYNANANFFGLLNVMAIVGLGCGILLYGHDESRT
jgi:hypothetical protein